MTPAIFSDVGGPWMIAFIAAPVAAGVLACVGLAYAGYWYVKRRRRLSQHNDPE